MEESKRQEKSKAPHARPTYGHADALPVGCPGHPPKRAIGRIAFANTDLAGAMDHRYSILEAHRAVGQLLDQVLT